MESPQYSFEKFDFIDSKERNNTGGSTTIILPFANLIPYGIIICVFYHFDLAMSKYNRNNFPLICVTSKISNHPPDPTRL